MKKVIVSMLSIFLFLVSFNYSFATDVCGTVDLGGATIGVGDPACIAATNGAVGWGGLNNSYGLPGGSIIGIITNILNWLLALFAIFGIIGFIISGIMYLTAAGDSSQAEKAKKAMQYSILGVIIGLSGFVILKAAGSLLSASKDI